MSSEQTTRGATHEKQMMMMLLWWRSPPAATTTTTAATLLKQIQSVLSDVTLDRLQYHEQVADRFLNHYRYIFQPVSIETTAIKSNFIGRSMLSMEERHTVIGMYRRHGTNKYGWFFHYLLPVFVLLAQTTSIHSYTHYLPRLPPHSFSIVCYYNSTPGKFYHHISVATFHSRES
jgi:hypothetical protein